MKVMTIVGTRPEIIRLSRVISVLDREMEHILVHTGQNYDYELNQVFFEDLALRRPDHYLDAAGVNAEETIGKVIIASDRILAAVRPDAVLILGDTNSSLAAISAKRHKIPVFHMEAGNRCFDQRVPEEINRVVVDHISDINLPYSEIARSYLIHEGLPPDRVIKTGSPMYEVISHYMQKIINSQVLDKLGVAVGGFFLVSCHREENVDSPQRLRRLVEILNRLSQEYSRKVIFSTHPRTRKRLEEAGLSFQTGIELMKPFPFTDYMKLQVSAKVVLSDSGTITEESSILNFPALNIREAHERPEGMEEAAVMLTGLSWERIRDGMHILETQGSGNSRTIRVVDDYVAPNVSEKIIRIILSYTDYVRRTVWHTGQITL